MCKYYAHAFVCHHTTFTFARYCTSANFTQKPCEQRQIWHTIGLDEACDECQMWFPDQYGSVMPRSKSQGVAAAGAPPAAGAPTGPAAVAAAVAKASSRPRKRCS
ncbi:uncharacterized protein PG998_006887 [Apiospora kogelbergensis]|uniref:Uncharacterized protein n=1 Tax=Apiospora kogelbergensis TaxID=1337665 RepID=A0AAW0QEX8_9PEZI